MNTENNNGLLIKARGLKKHYRRGIETIKALAEKGMTIVAPSDKLVGDLKQVGGVMLADWEKKAGADGTAVLAAFRKP